MEKLKSRKFWVCVVYAVVYLVMQFGGVNLDIEEVLGLAIPIIGYLFGQSWVDSKANTPK